MGPILGIHQTMGIYGHLEGFLLHRGLFWASNIMTPVFWGVHRYFFWGLWRMPVNPINVAMLTMEVLNPLVQKTYIFVTPHVENVVCFLQESHVASVTLVASWTGISKWIRSNWGMWKTHMFCPCHKGLVYPLAHGGSVQCGKVDLSFVSLTYIFSSIGLIGILFTLFYFSMWSLYGCE